MCLAYPPPTHISLMKRAIRQCFVGHHQPSVQTREFLLRTGLVIIFVVVSHQFEWMWLRFVTSEALLRISVPLGLTMSRVSPDTLSVPGMFVRFVTSCTFIDVYFGAVPIVWDTRKSPLTNFGHLIPLGLGLFAFNLFRLEIAQQLYAEGVSWTVCDQVLGGLAYFVVWVPIATRSGYLGGRKTQVMAWGKLP